MEDLIQQLVTQYLNNEITWHDIQDDVEVYVLKQDGKGGLPGIEVIRDRFNRANIILQEIEKRIYEGV